MPRRLKPAVRISVALAVVSMNLLIGCKERMRDQPSLMPNDRPTLSVPAGAVPVEGGEPAPTLEEAAALANPVENVPDEIAAGRAAYRRFCSHCHGTLGRGRTVVGASLDPGPTDLSAALEGKSDGELFSIVTFGRKTSPALGPVIDVLDRWRIVRFLHTLPAAARGAPPAWGQ